MNNDYLSFAINYLQKNGGIPNNPQAQQYIDLIKSGDNEKGRQVAENICKTYGITMEEAGRMAMQMFFGNR